MSFNDTIVLLEYADNCLCIMDLMSSKIIKSNFAHFGEITSIATAPITSISDTLSGYIASAATDQSIILWKIDKKRKTQPVSLFLLIWVTAM